MTEKAPRVIAVRQGVVQPTGSWLYVWIDTANSAVAYVGATGLDPELRAHLHLTSDNPDHGRIRATVSRYAERDFDVLAFAVPSGTSRPAAKDALVAELAARGYVDSSVVAAPMEAVTAPIISTIEDSLRGLR
ncbi:hypothetical protein [Diaminobutyricimonas sp. LJ205]|uniref:hypothetical protein n=1 Tax=Diaminobutyricimonas sp. LJ205 TaxID=2683590 RepID=UPI0012F50769|nr:hypothetical protein [Diaminobutyricimonas sp. LJ205]